MAKEAVPDRGSLFCCPCGTVKKSGVGSLDFRNRPNASGGFGGMTTTIHPFLAVNPISWIYF